MALVRHDFRAVCHRLRARQGGSTPSSELLPVARARGPFASEARQVWESISSMRKFVCEQAAPGRSRLTSSAERDEVENVGSEFHAVCSKRLDALEASLDRSGSVAGARPSAQHRAHMAATLATLYEQLALLSTHLESFRAAFVEETGLRGRELVPTSAGGADGGAREPRSWEQMVGCKLEMGALSAEEQSQLELENAELQSELNSMVDEVRMVESKMIEISALSSTFASKLVEQSKSIENIQQDTVAAADYVRSGNTSLDSAEKHARGFRFYQLLFFLIAGLALLLCDWWYS